MTLNSKPAPQWQPDHKLDRRKKLAAELEAALACDPLAISLSAAQARAIAEALVDH